MSMTLETIREQFPGLNDKVFLDSACVGLAPKPATDAIAGFLQEAMRCGARSSTLHHLAMDAARDAARPEAARLIAALPEEIALVESTTHGLSIAARAIPLQPGDNILIGDLEYLQVPLPWRQPAAGIAPEIRMVASREGALDPEDFAARMDRQTRAVVVSSVQWCNGFRCNLGALGRICRDNGSFLVVDAVQQLGAFRLDVRETPVDFIACGGHKWLNAPFGAGFLYVGNETRERLQSPLCGYLAANPPAGGWGEYFQTPGISPLQPVSFRQDAARFETGGTANYPGAVGLAASLRMINEIGPLQIEVHIRTLTDYLLMGLQSLPLRVTTRPDPEHRSGIVSFTLGTAAEDVALMESLLDRRILVSVRYTSGVGGVRVSCHFFNSRHDLDRLLNAVADHLGRS